MDRLANVFCLILIYGFLITFVLKYQYKVSVSRILWDDSTNSQFVIFGSRNLLFALVEGSALREVCISPTGNQVR